METTLTQVCDHLNNHFVKSVERGTFTISGGSITLRRKPLTGQYIWLVGGVLANGIYKVTDSMPVLVGYSVPISAEDETFNGAVALLAVPAGLVEIAGEIETFQTKQAADKSNPTLISESYSGYSYSRATGTNGTPATWTEVFASRLNGYRRMYRERV